MPPNIPPHLRTKAAMIPESSYGACTVTLILASGKTIPDVVLAGGEEIVKVGGALVGSARDLPFRIGEIVDLY